MRLEEEVEGGAREGEAGGGHLWVSRDVHAARISGTADDDVYPPQYEVRENKYPGLAASARAAREANEQAILDEERARKKAQQEARDFVAREMAEYAGLTADDLEAELRI